MSSVKVHILGCGTSTGVPLIGCNCPVCDSDDLKNNRLRASIWIQAQGKSILVDTSTDLRIQALRAGIPRVDAVLFTHPHADHIHGIDELRSYNFVQKEPIPVYGNAWTEKELIKKFEYIFRATGPAEGGGIPQLNFHPVDSSAETLDILGLKFIPIAVEHGSKECLGYRIDSVAYVTDCSYIPPDSKERLKGLSVLILDCVRLQSHRTHFNLDQALETISELRPEKTYLTHLGHDFDYRTWMEKLPEGVELAYDGLEITA